MAKYITIDQAVEAITKTQGLRSNALFALYKLPTIDIVHCKDCKYYGEGYIHNTKWSPCTAVETNEDWFCADGERKE